MDVPALRVNGLGKRYRLGLTHAGSLSEVASRWTRRLRGLPPVEPPVDAIHGVDPSDRRGDFWALKDVGFEVQPGEVVGVIGRNGAGKSTLLKILAKVTAPTTGEVRVRGRVGSLLEVGTGFHPELTGRENIYMNATLLGMTRPEVKAKLDEIVDFSGVEMFLDTPVKRYSSGMKVRLGFAVAAHLEPEVLIVDEVLSVGDAEFQQKCLGKMKDVAGKGRTVLFVSHNIGAVRSLCQTGLLLVGGTVSASGAVDEVVDRYLSLRTPVKPGELGVRSALERLPKDEAVELCDVRLVQFQRNVDKIDCDEAFDLRIVARVCRETVDLRFFVDLIGPSETFLLRTFHDEQAKRRTVAKSGVHEYILRFPPSVLARKKYECRVHATIHNVRRCTGDGLPIVVDGRDTPRRATPYGRPDDLSLIAPRLHWEAVSPKVSEL